MRANVQMFELALGNETNQSGDEESPLLVCPRSGVSSQKEAVCVGPQSSANAVNATRTLRQTETRAMSATNRRVQATRSQKSDEQQQDTAAARTSRLAAPLSHLYRAIGEPPSTHSAGPLQMGPAAQLANGRWRLAAAVLWLVLLPLASCQTNAPEVPQTDGLESSTTAPIEITTSSSMISSNNPESSFIEATTSSSNQSVITKLKPVNFTLVDEIFDAVLSEEEVVKRWRFMDSQIQDGMKSILKMLFPQIVSISQDAKVSGDCSGGILKWILSLRNLRSWAIKMLDATGKPTAGIFEGSLTMFGNYRQCLNIRAPDEDEIEITDQFEEYFRGQFCVIHLKPWMPVKQPFYHLNSTIESLLRKNYKYYEKTLYDELAEIAIAFNFVDIRMDLCVPSTCTVADIQRVAELLSKKLEMRAKVMRCDIASRETNPLNHLDRYSYYWLALPLSLLLLSLLATVSLAFKFGKSDTADRQAGDLERPASDKKRSESKLTAILQCLSIGGAIKDRLAMPPGNLPLAKFGDRSGEQDSGSGGQVTEPHVSLNLQRKPLPLYGLRNVFIFWFLIVQMTVELKYQYLRESLLLRNMIISYWPFQIIVNSAFLFESLILITAFTFSYTCLESSMKDLFSYVVDKYIRLILSIVTLIALTIVTPLINIESPVWRNFVEQQSNVCKSTGYLDLMFLQNFISYDKICLPHTWLFCVEIQLIILSIPLVLLLKKTFMSTEDSVIVDQAHPSDDRHTPPPCLTKIAFCRLFKTRAGILIVVLIVSGSFINFFTVYTNKLPPSWFYTFPDVEQKNYYFTKYLTKTWTHLSAFAIGLVAGHICRSTIQLRKVRLLKKHQLPQRNEEQASPAPSVCTNQSQLASRQSHGSTSTITATERESVRQERDRSIYLEQKRAGQYKILTSLSSHLAAACCMAAIIFSTFSWSTKEAPAPFVAAIYDAGSRILWSIALVGLMIQLCLPDEETGSYSTIARVLSHPLCTLMGRLSFLAYLISPYVNTFVLAVEEQSLFPSLFLIFHVSVGNIVITYILAFILSIVIEQPLRRLISRFVLGKRFRKQKINISTYYANNSPEQIPTISTPKKDAK